MAEIRKRVRDKTASWWIVQEKGWKRRQIIVGAVCAFFGLSIAIAGVALPFVERGSNSQSPLLVLAGFGLIHLVGGVAFALGRRWSRAIMWPICALYLMAFPMGVLLGGYGLWVLYHTRESLDPPGKLAFVAGCAGAVLLVLLGFTNWYSDPLPPTFAERVLATIDAQGGTTELRRWFSAPDTAHDQSGAMLSLVHRGLVRLNAEDQLIHTQFVSYVLDQASVADCAAYTRGSASTAQQRALTHRLDSLWVKQGADVEARAILAEIRRYPPAQPASEIDLAAYVALVYDSLSTSDRRRFDAAKTSLSTVSDEDACWFGRVFVARALEQPAPRTRWVRAVTTLRLSHSPEP